MAVDALGHVYVTEMGNSTRVQQFTNDGVFIRSWGEEAGPGRLHGASGIAVDESGLIHVADAGQNCVLVFTNAGVFVRRWGSTGCPAGYISNPWSLAADGHGHIYISDDFRISKYTSAGTFVLQWGTDNCISDGQFIWPISVTTDGAGHVYAADYADHVFKFTNTGALLARWGSTGTGNGEFRGILGIAADQNGSLYVSDLSNCRIQKFGDVATPAASSTWGRVKSTYRR